MEDNRLLLVIIATEGFVLKDYLLERHSVIVGRTSFHHFSSVRSCRSPNSCFAIAVKYIEVSIPSPAYFTSSFCCWSGFAASSEVDWLFLLSDLAVISTGVCRRSREPYCVILMMTVSLQRLYLFFCFNASEILVCFLALLGLVFAYIIRSRVAVADPRRGRGHAPKRPTEMTVISCGVVTVIVSLPAARQSDNMYRHPLAALRALTIPLLLMMMVIR